MRNLEIFPPPVSETHQKFIEKLAENVEKIKLRRRSLPGELTPSGDEAKKSKTKISVNSGLRKKILEGKKDLQKHEEKKEKTFMEGEKELWQSGD